MDYKQYLNFYPDFPIKGVNFVDIIPLIQDKQLFRQLTKDLAAMCTAPNIAAPEARGFLFSTPMLYDPDIPVENVIPLRKKGKLPFAAGDLIQVEIMKEYGPDHVYFRNSDIAASKPTGDTVELTFFDDILATGGTARGLALGLNAQKVTIDGKQYNVKVKDFVFLVEIDDLPGRKRLEDIAPVKSLIHVKESD
jgi:adenine phosphoribosyltransferase